MLVAGSENDKGGFYTLPLTCKQEVAVRLGCSCCNVVRVD